MSDELSVAVIGAGAMGSNHVRVLKQLPGVNLAAVVDQDVERARRVAGSSLIPIFKTVDELPPGIHAAIVAVPTPAHSEVARRLAARNIHMLIEKPLASSLAEAEDLIALIEERNLTIAVGHVERFNPVVVELPRLLSTPLHFEASRISPYTPRIGDGVIFDLTIHDIDIVCSLLPADSEVSEIQGVARRSRSATEDLASIVMTFSTGQTAAFHTSRLGQTKIRTIEVTQAESAITADLLRQDITISRMSKHEYLTEDGLARHRQSNVVEIPFLETRGEPLARELSNFIDSVLTGVQPVVTGAEGARAVGIAQRALSSVRMM